MRTTLAIVGLGTAGAAAAALASSRGLDVIGIDARSLDDTGARWVNGVPPWAFDEAGLDRPQPPELFGEAPTFHLIGGWGPERVTMPGLQEVDMRKLTERLQLYAEHNGARLLGRTRVTGFDGQGLETTAGRIDADVILDASGLNGMNLLRHPAVPATDLCVAAQGVHAVADKDGARAFLDANRAAPGEVVCFSGIAGGYSIVNVRVEADLSEVSILTGTIPGLGYPSGRALKKQFIADQGWIGEMHFGGARAIPLHRPWTRIARGRFASIGDSAGMVHSAHGSGIAMQLVAARMLADTLAEGGSPWDYNVAWQRRWGGLLAGADLQRRFLQRLSTRTVRALIRRGVLSPAIMEGPLQQRPPRPSPTGVARALPGLATVPRTVRHMLPALARGEALALHYKRYPEDPRELGAWRAALARLSGTVD